MKKTGILALLTAGALMLSGCGKGANSGDVAMEIGDVKVTTNDISALVGSMMGQYSMYGYDFSMVKDMMMNDLENAIKIGKLAEAMGIELTDEEKDSVILGKAQYAQMGGGLEAYKEYLAEAGSNIDFIEEYVTGQVLQTQVSERINAELGDAEATDDELKAYYADNYYRAKHILIEKEAEEIPVEETAEAATEAATEAAAEEPSKEPKELADELLERAKNGEDFDAMITEYTADPGSETNPDGYIFTEGDMVAEFEDCVKSLQIGEFGICESDYGYHIIQRLPFSADEAKFEEWFTANKAGITSSYSNNKYEDKFNALCEEYGIKVVINQDVIDAFTEEDYVELDTSGMMGM